MSKAAYLEAVQRATEKEAKRASKKLRAQARATAANGPSVQLLQPMDQSSAAPSAPVESQRSAVKAAQSEESQTKPRVCVCHGDRPVEMHGLCRKSCDSLRFTRPARLPSDVVGWRRERAMEVAHKIRPAKTKFELTQAKMANPDVANYVFCKRH